MAELKTVFWKRAAQSMPAAYRARYVTYLLRAERFDLALDAVIDTVARIRASLRAPKHA